MRWLPHLVLVLALLLPRVSIAQSSEVLPSELDLSVSVEKTSATPFVREMVLITIRGVYRRHITLESIVQPDFEGFSWAQLGPDSWREERLDGKKVKVFRRRMAVYPNRAGTLRIGAFTHKLTLTDEGDDWFEHEISSEPVTIKVAPAPPSKGWWFPTKSLRISDDWSNAPNQLKPGEGVLRIVRLEALGVTPEMIPPMPELKSPSAMIFPHPEKRLVELTPEGPLTYAFWRWTIRPSNDISTIVEPLTFSYYDTRLREAREVTISAQRIAYGTVTGEPLTPPTAALPEPASLPGWPVAALAGLVFAGGLAIGLRGRTASGFARLARLGPFDAVARRLRRMARCGQRAGTRRAALDILNRDSTPGTRDALIQRFDRAAFDPKQPQIDLSAFARDVLRSRR